jgi:hypothetical protein
VFVHEAINFTSVTGRVPLMTAECVVVAGRVPLMTAECVVVIGRVPFLYQLSVCL